MGHSVNSNPNKKSNVARVAWYIAVRFIAFLAVAGLGMGLMYFADNYRLMIAMGIVYLIIMCAIILVVAAEEMDSMIRKRLTAKT